MNILYRILLGTCIAVSAGTLAAQTPATGNESTGASTQTSAKHKSTSAKHVHHTKHAQTKKSAQHVAKTKTGSSYMPEESAYHQALRGCAMQRDESQRNSCLDDAIEKFHRNA